MAAVILVALAAPVLCVQYNPGVTVGQYVRYGNFVGIGIGYEPFNNYGFLNLQVVSVSGSLVTLLSTGEYKNGTALPGSGTSDIWDLSLGTKKGVPTPQGYIIAANLNQGDEIPPANTYSVNQTADRTYLGTTRSVNILNVTISTPGYDTTQNYVYDKLSGMLLEASSTTVTQLQPQTVTSMFSYSVIATNIFGSTNPTPTVPELSPLILMLAVAISVAIAVVITQKRNVAKGNQN